MILLTEMYPRVMGHLETESWNSGYILGSAVQCETLTPFLRRRQAAASGREKLIITAGLISAATARRAIHHFIHDRLIHYLYGKESKCCE